MKINCYQQMFRVILASGIVLVASSVINKPIQAQQIDRENSCQKSSQNSNCEDETYSSKTKETNAESVDWDSLCQKFPLNSRCREGRPEIIKIPLASSGAKDEWIRIDKVGDRVKLLHTRESDGGLLSNAFNGAAGAVLPIPLPNIKLGEWSDHKMTGVTFKPDSCQENSTNKAVQKNSSSCAIAGKDTLVLPKGTDIYAGLFTIEYTEGDLERSIKFRVPKQEN
jgi:hypothetical protein